MRPQNEPAHTPASEDPSTRFRTTTRRRRLVARSVSAVLLLSVACSRVIPVGTHAKAPQPRDAKGRVHEPDPVHAEAKREETTARDETRATSTPTELDSKNRSEASRTDDGSGPKAASVDHAVAPAEKAPLAPPPANKPALKGDSRAYGLSGLAASAAASAGAGLGRLGGGREAPSSIAKERKALAPHGAAGAGRAFIGRSASPQAGMALLARPAPTTALGPLAQPPGDFNTEAYKSTPDNPFRLVTEAPLSTFSVDVDTASYSNMRRFVQEGRLPPADAIRTEEWVNYFGYDDPAPADGEPIAVASELTQCPWAPGHELLRVALTTAPITQEKVPPRNLVFLVDVSGSMQPANKLPLLKRGLALLARQLRPVDTLSIVVYAGASGVALPPTSGADQSKILAALDGLESGGSTNGAEGIQLAYRVAEQQMKRGGINRVLLATDGDFNVGVTSDGELTRLIEEKRKSGVFLTVLGFGEGNLKDATMESLADKGNGNYAYIDSLAEARKVLVHEAGATLVTVAKDVKLQLEFNPTHVKGYRLVGYEDRVLADQDFNDDTKDAGDMGAGHHVTAFYEIVPASKDLPVAAPAIDPLKYQTARQPAGESASSELLTVKIRYKAPSGSRSLLLSRPVADHVVPLPSTSESLRFGVAVAEYALALRGADGVGVTELPAARSLALGALGADPRHERREFVALMDRASHLPRN